MVYNMSMQIKSSAFENNEKIPAKYTCDGQNINPPLTFSQVPKEAKSLVLIVDDPDAPGKTWTHWVLYNILSSTLQILENQIPEGAVEGVTDFGSTGYGGPCPPSGTHRYFFKLYALDTTLDLEESATKADVEEKIKDHIIEKAELIGLYSRI